MTIRTDPGCGNETHFEDCLCDVVIDKPVPIRYGLSSFWYKDEDEDYVDVLQRIAIATEAKSEQDQGLERLRNVIQALHQYGYSPSAVQEHLGLSHDEYCYEVTGGRKSYSWEWPIDKWDAVWETANSPGAKPYTLVRLYGMNSSQSYNMMTLFTGSARELYVLKMMKRGKEL